MTIFSDLADSIDNAPVIGPVPQGEYRVRILHLDLRTQVEEKGGRQFLMATLEVVDEPTADDITEFVSFVPAAGDGSKNAVREKNRIRDFLRAFDLPSSVLSQWDDSIPQRCPAAEGYTAKALLDVQADRRDTGRQVNFVRQWL